MPLIEPERAASKRSASRPVASLSFTQLIRGIIILLPHYCRSSYQPLSAGATEGLHRALELYVFRNQPIVLKSPDRLPVSTAAEHDSCIESGQVQNEHRREELHPHRQRHPVVEKTGCSNDHATRCEGPLDRVERLRMNLRIGIHEREYISLGCVRAAVARGCDRSLLDSDYAATARPREVGRAIGGGIVYDDNFDLIALPRVSTPCQFDAVEEPGKMLFLVEGWNDH